MPRLDPLPGVAISSLLDFSLPDTFLLPHHDIFPPLDVPPAHPNTDPHTNKSLSDSSSIPSITLSLNASTWSHYLQDYPDCNFVNMIIHIIHHGANTGYLADHNHSQLCSNLHSATDHPLAIEADIIMQVAAGRTSGPFNGPPLPFFHLSPQGAVTQKHQSKVRRIFHLSWPHGSLVNDGILDTEASISYDMFFKVVEDLRASGIGSLFIKLDLEQAFCQIPVRQENWHLLGFSWADKFYYDLALCFGLHSASYIFNLFAEALHWIIKCHIPGYLWHYLDDFLAIFSLEKSHDTVQKALDWILALGKQLGLRFQPSKVDGPTTVIEFLGIILDSIKMEAHLPDVKLAYLQEQLVLWQSRRDCMLQELYELTGYLQFCSQVIPMSCAFICSMHDFSSSFSSPFTCCCIPPIVHADIDWWTNVALHWNGVHLIHPHREVIYVYTDASGTKGLSGIFGTKWFSAHTPWRICKEHIQVKEMYAALHSALCWGNEF